MKRRKVIIVLAMIAASCHRPARDVVEAAPTSTLDEQRTINPVLLGTWRAYDDDAHKVLGALEVMPDRLVFAKGLMLRMEPDTPMQARVNPTDGAKPVWGKDGLCGAAPVLSVSFALPDSAKPKELRLSVHDVASGPGPDPDFDLHRCQTFTYVRD